MLKESQKLKTPQKNPKKQTISFVDHFGLKK